MQLMRRDLPLHQQRRTGAPDRRWPEADAGRRRRRIFVERRAAAGGGGGGEGDPAATPPAVPPRLEARLRQLAERRGRIERARKRAVLRDAALERRRLRRAAADFTAADDGGAGAIAAGAGGSPPSPPSSSSSFPQRLGRLLRELSRPPPRPRSGKGWGEEEDDPLLGVYDDDDGEDERRRAEQRRRERAAAVQSRAAALLAALAAAALLAQWWPLFLPLARYVWHAGPLEAWPAIQSSLWTYPETPATALLQFNCFGGGGVGGVGGGGGGGWWRPLSSGLLGSGLAGGALVARGLASSAWWVEACAPFGGGAGAAIAAFALSSVGACLGGALLPWLLLASSPGGAAAAAAAAGGPAVAVLAGPGAVVGMHVAWAVLALRLRRDWRRERTRAPPLEGGALEDTMAAAAEARGRTGRGGEGGGEGGGAQAAAAVVEEESKRMFEVIVALERGSVPPLGRLPESLLPPPATAGGLATVVLLAALSLAQPAANPLSLAGGALGGAVAARFSVPLSRAVGAALRAPLFLSLAALRIGARAALSAAGMLLAFAAATVKGVGAAVQTVRGL